ncbi:MAG TPA: mechanosensitive ion channel family protein [Bryobacteraceae bacterium]|nr:mechanosensitive ion channel family protein [Bryobacteraceae bacterium]
MAWPSPLRAVLLVVCASPVLFAAAAPAGDSLRRDNPRSSVTAFLQACERGDYDSAAQYLDLRNWSAANRKSAGPAVAKKLEAALNYAPDFSVMHLTQNPEGSSGESAGTPRETVAVLTESGQSYTLELERVSLQQGQPLVWIFTPGTIAAALNMNLSRIAPWLSHYLPPFLVSVEFLSTPLWAWLAMLLAGIVLFILARSSDRLLLPLLHRAGERVTPQWQGGWANAILRPVSTILAILVFRLVMELVRPSAVARLYIGRLLELIFMWSIALCAVRIVDLLLTRMESNMASRHQFSGRSILRLGRRTASVTIVIVVILMVLASWGYNTATLVAGLGVGGIAVALAAQQTIANIFGGVSVIGDHPVSIGDFGKFGDIVGTVEDIGMRSTQIRTLARTVISVPNSSFASANLENYSARDKILFNPTLQIKRTTPDEEVWRLIDLLGKALAANRSVELVPTPVRLVGLTAASFNIEVFCYVLSANQDEFYKVQGQLFLAINEALQAAHLELV